MPTSRPAPRSPSRSPERRRGTTGTSGRPLQLAGVLTGVLALVVLGVALATLLQRHGMFSAGVGVMLLLYGLLLAALAVLAVRGVTLVTGMVVAAGALHVMVAVSLALNGAPWLWAGVPLPLMTVVAGVWARVREQRELTRLS